MKIDRMTVRRYILIGPSDDRKAFAMKLKDEFRLTIIDCGQMFKEEFLVDDGSGQAVLECS